MNTNIDEAEERRRGMLIANLLNLKHLKDYSDRYATNWGTKTDLGLFRLIKRIILDGE